MQTYTTTYNNYTNFNCVFFKNLLAVLLLGLSVFTLSAYEAHKRAPSHRSKTGSRIAGPITASTIGAPARQSRHNSKRLIKSHRKQTAPKASKASPIKKRVSTTTHSSHLKHAIALDWPVSPASFQISSPYGPRKNVDGSTGFHRGLDLAAAKGTPIKAPCDGVVLKVTLVENPKDSKGYGNMVLLAHKTSNGTLFKTRYAHCDKVYVKVGQKIPKGMLIATVGNTGNVRTSTGGDGSHLHLELYVGKNRVNPRSFLPRHKK